MIDLNKSNIILVIFFSIAICYLLWMMYVTYFKKQTEHFTESEKLDDYGARMTVMKIFDTVLHRKPTRDEIDKYSKITNEQDMLVAVLGDFKVTTNPTTTDPTTNDSQTIDTAVADGTGETFVAPLPSKNKDPAIDLKSIETSLTAIMDAVNSIRSSLYTQTLCESEE